MGYLLITNADGRSHIAKAVLACVQRLVGDGLDDSWNIDTREYDARLYVNFWDMPKSHGYIISLSRPGYPKQVNLAIFEDPGSDNIVVVRCETEVNENIRSTDFPEFFSNDRTTENFRYDEVYPAARYIFNQLGESWEQFNGR